jgi:hypothetical protein
VPKELAAEDDLRGLARRFADAERRVRSLLQEAPTGNRRVLLAEALSVLLALRWDAIEAGVHVERAYHVAAVAINRLTGQPIPAAEKAHRLGLALSWRLDAAVAQAEEGARRAFAQVQADTTAEQGAAAVTVGTDRAGRARYLGAEADMLTRTLGRRAVSMVPRDMGIELVDISGGTCPICEPFQGEHPATLEPPFHASCGCVATPIGFSYGEYQDAMAAVAS